MDRIAHIRHGEDFGMRDSIERREASHHVYSDRTERLCRLLYTSKLSADNQLNAGETITSIFLDSMSQNHHLDIGGFTTCSHSKDDTILLQVIEGSIAGVNQVYARIKQDSRHTEIRQLYCIPIEQRAMHESGMVYIDEARWSRECDDTPRVRLTFGSVLVASTLAEAQDITRGIAESSIQQYPAHGVTGCLFVNRYTRRAVHVLEGPASAVHQLYGQLCKDKHLGCCTVLRIEAITLRRYRRSYMLVEGLRATWSTAEHANDANLIYTIARLMSAQQANTEKVDLPIRASALTQKHKSAPCVLSPPARLPSSEAQPLLLRLSNSADCLGTESISPKEATSTDQLRTTVNDLSLLRTLPAVTSLTDSTQPALEPNTMPLFVQSESLVPILSRHRWPGRLARNIHGRNIRVVSPNPSPSRLSLSCTTTMDRHSDVKARSFAEDGESEAQKMKAASSVLQTSTPPAQSSTSPAEVQTPPPAPRLSPSGGGLIQVSHPNPAPFWTVRIAQLD
eukprot:CAMPEP_0119344096 /NCGR_PEP_ID=MMETSP1333-20130426/106793_1 /TAXON_ID=418940 /ORGANISM="Scyphosphaera apsteinii, Strain RCC1455" /LENGTH=508 /DNA_ID=CAMNT_0007356519 /DNA_START=21 /DNA_END=1547 /DNA_ORIENTATION=+